MVQNDQLFQWLQQLHQSSPVNSVVATAAYPSAGGVQQAKMPPSTASKLKIWLEQKLHGDALKVSEK
jgi:hypothetical protein